VRAAVLATGGAADLDVDREGLAAWAELAGGRFDLRVFPGGHFYLVEDEAALVDAVADRLPPG
jgi:pyochelin biosynthetic protein PchC